MKLTRPQILPLLILVSRSSAAITPGRKLPSSLHKCQPARPSTLFGAALPPVMQERQILFSLSGTIPTSPHFALPHCKICKAAPRKTPPSRNSLAKRSSKPLLSLRIPSCSAICASPKQKRPQRNLMNIPGTACSSLRSYREGTAARQNCSSFPHPGKRASANFHRHRRRRPCAQNRSKR